MTPASMWTHRSRPEAVVLMSERPWAYGEDEIRKEQQRDAYPDEDEGDNEDRNEDDECAFWGRFTTGRHDECPQYVEE